LSSPQQTYHTEEGNQTTSLRHIVHEDNQQINQRPWLPTKEGRKLAPFNGGDFEVEDQPQKIKLS
jgi:hypothetical protein